MRPKIDGRKWRPPDGIQRGRRKKEALERARFLEQMNGKFLQNKSLDVKEALEAKKFMEELKAL